MGIRKAQQKREADLRRSLKLIDLQFSGFGPEFYQQREQAYLGYALPEIAEQYDEARKSLVYSLANRGLRRSSAAATESAKLAATNAEMQRRAAETGIAESNQLRNAIEGQRANLQQLAIGGLEPQSVAVSTRMAASQYQQPSVFAPVGQLFSDFANMYQAKAIADAYREQTPALFSTSGVVTKVR